MKWTRAFNELAVGVGAIGALVIALFSLQSGLKLAAASAFTLLGVLVVIGVVLVARGRGPRTIHRAFRVDEGEYETVSFNARRGADVNVTVHADDSFDAWLLDDDGLARFESDRSFEPYDEARSSTMATLAVRARQTGTLHLVIDCPMEDDDEDETDDLGFIDVQLTATVSKPN